MSPKPADPGVRTALIECAARLLAEGGPEALTIRRLAGEVGTSTMSVYTHFGGMDDLRSEMRREGYLRLAEAVKAVAPTRDPVADLASNGWAYVYNAMTNPHLYRVMFLEGPVRLEDAEAGLASFMLLVEIVQRCIAAGRFAAGDPYSMALQLWVMSHGLVTLRLSGLMTDETLIAHFVAMGENMLVGLGDDRAAASRSIQRAVRRMESELPPESLPFRPVSEFDMEKMRPPEL